MNKFETNDNGGLPVSLDDYRFMQNSWREGFDAIFREFGVTPATAVILTGVVQSDGGANFDYTEGFVYMNGEIFKFEAASVIKPAGGQDHFLLIQQTVDANGNKVFEDAVSHDTYFVRKAVIEVHPTGAPPANSIIYADINVRRVADLRKGNIIHVMDQKNLVDITPVAGDVHSVVPSATHNAALMAVRFQARLQHDNTGGATDIVPLLRIKRDAAQIKFVTISILNDGAQHGITLIGMVEDYVAGETISIEGETNTSTVHVEQTTLEVEALNAFIP